MSPEPPTKLEEVVLSARKDLVLGPKLRLVQKHSQVPVIQGHVARDRAERVSLVKPLLFTGSRFIGFAHPALSENEIGASLSNRKGSPARTVGWCSALGGQHRRAPQRASPQRLEGLICLLQRKALHLDAQRNLRGEVEELPGVGSG